MTTPAAKTPIYDRVALIGLGLIASSMAHAMRQFGLAREIVGHAKSAETRAIAVVVSAMSVKKGCATPLMDLFSDRSMWPKLLYSE